MDLTGNTSAKTPVVRSITVTDDNVAPMLPDGMSLHFMSGNRIQVSYGAIPFKPIVNCGVTRGQLWLSGVPSWLDLTMVDKSIYSYISNWTPGWLYQVNVLQGNSSGPSILPQIGQTAGSPRPSFDWSSIVQSGGKYDFQVSPDASFTNTVVNKGGLRDRRYTLSESESLPNGQYYWRIREYDKIWFTSLPVWLNLKKYDHSIIGLPVFAAINTDEHRATISYISR
jgi:hypothetical protein